MIQLKAIVIGLICFLMISACSFATSNEKEKMPGITTPVEEMNQYFRIASAPDLTNSFKNGELISLWVRNLSNEAIAFPNDYGIKLFNKEGEDWVTIENLLEYSIRDKFLPPEKEYPPGKIAGMVPYIPGMAEKTIVRIVIVGTLKDQPEEEVAAYLDVVLRP